MKYLNRLLAGVLLVGMTACSSDEPNPGTGGGSESSEPLYSSITFKMPGARSGAANEGEEVGKDYENNVGSILVILAKGDSDNGPFKFLTYALNDAPAASEQSKFTITFQDKETLFNEAGKEVYVFAYCNPTQKLRDAVSKLDAPADFTDLICGENGDVASVSDTWKKNAFLMTSVEIHKVTLADEATLKTFNTPENAFNLCPDNNSIEVIRTASRFDIKDVSVNKDWSYEIKNQNAAGTPVMGKVTLKRVALFNLRNQFYYLPRVISGDATENKLCPGMLGMEFGVDATGNVTNEVYVVSPSDKTFLLSNPETIDPNATLSEGTELGNLEWTDLASLDEDDRHEGSWDKDTDANKDYKIWRYATENTFAKGATADDITYANTTGVVFEAEITVAEDFGNVVEGNAQPMYLYGGVLYANAMNIAKAIEANPSSTLSTAFAACFDPVKNGDDITGYAPKDGVILSDYGFTEYKPNAAGKYLCYYWYYNRHVDDNTPSAIGPMEFATVRNNIYKLAVTNIKQFGTFTPPDPDKWDVYFTLDVQLRNWVVRVNSNIEF